jgi:hypothetical protein
MRTHRVAMHPAFVQLRVHPLASWVRQLDQQRRQNHRLSILLLGCGPSLAIWANPVRFFVVIQGLFKTKFRLEHGLFVTKFRCLQGLQGLFKSKFRTPTPF